MLENGMHVCSDGKQVCLNVLKWKVCYKMENKCVTMESKCVKMEESSRVCGKWGKMCLSGKQVHLSVLKCVASVW